MKIKEEIQQKANAFLQICQSHHVASLYVFGSSFTDKFDEASSDVDLLVEIDEPDPVLRGEQLMSLWDQLETFFQRKVDLLTYSSVKNPVLKKNIEATKLLIYDGRGQKVLV
ncbi:nucleotidyltransferase domain-containing protein [Catalinimonas sp. 4WD22]|uniref:nucleotidyltransferase family protein n=1 Tax=Catalinimonas locisalis TaxID=3133978 RepID=UPI00310117F8